MGGGDWRGDDRRGRGMTGGGGLEGGTTRS